MPDRESFTVRQHSAHCGFYLAKWCGVIAMFACLSLLGGGFASECAFHWQGNSSGHLRAIFVQALLLAKPPK
jgi:hypothetical protein